MLINQEFFQKLADVAAAESMPRFRQLNEIDNKYETGFDPVTEADRAAERAIRKLIGEKFPDHGILGEEYGAHNTDNSHVWVIDPIDGTRAFISGLPVWGTLIGLTIDGDAKSGMMSQPFTGELYFSDGHGTYLSHGKQALRALKTRHTKNLKEATLFTTTPSLFKDKKHDGFERLQRDARLTRYGVDCYAFAMLASGFVDVVIETGLQPYDIVALIPIIEQAGGVISQIDGSPAEAGGDVIAAATPELHEAAIACYLGS